MNNLGTSSMAIRHGENNNSFSGTKSKAKKDASYVEKETVKAYAKIKSAAKNNNTTPEKIALDYLLRNTDKMEAYIRSKGETPASSNPGMAAQCVLLRMNDINIVQSAANLTEDEALKEIQEAESEAILFDTPDKDNVLNPEMQAALNCLIVVLLTKVENKTGVSDISGALKLIKVDSATPVNNAIGDDYSSIDSTSGLQLNLTPGASAAITNDTDGSSSSDFWDILDKIAGTASTVSGAISNISQAVSGGVLSVGNAIQTTGANTGASAISLYMQRNGLTILIIGLLSIVLLIILVRVTRNK